MLPLICKSGSNSALKIAPIDVEPISLTESHVVAVAKAKYLMRKYLETD